MFPMCIRMTSKNVRSKQLTGVETNTGAGAASITAGAGITVTKTGSTNTVATSGLESFLVAPTWESLNNFDGSNLMAAGVQPSNLGAGYQIGSAARLKVGGAYLVMLRGQMVKAGGFTTNDVAFTLPVGWRPVARRSISAVDILPSGQVLTVLAIPSGMFSLEGVSFWTN
jgi:hypothetical protein